MELGANDINRRPNTSPNTTATEPCGTGLQVVLLLEDHFQRERPPTTPDPDEQHRAPRAQHGRGGPEKRPQHLWVLADRTEEREAGESHVRTASGRRSVFFSDTFRS